MSSPCIIDKSIKWMLMFFSHCNQLDQNRTIYVCFFMLHFSLLTVLSEQLCMFLYNLTVVTSQKLTVKAKKTLWFFLRIPWSLFHLNSQGFDWQHTCWACFSQTVGIPMCINSAPISPICSFVRTKKTSRKINRS
jgi:hypothetical protein